MSRWRRTRPRPRCPAYSPPATSPTKPIGRQSRPRALAAWPPSKPNAFSPCARATARRRNSHGSNSQRIYRYGLGQAEGVSRGGGSRQLHACRRAAWSVAIGRLTAGQRAGAGAFGVAVPPPARGLILTEQGDLLFRTAHDVFMQLQAARAKLTDSRERPSGDLKIQTPPALGINWLIPRLDEFTALYPDIRISLIVTDQDLDLSMREAHVAIRNRKPTQPDLIQRKLFSIGFHAYCSPEYIKRFGTPRTLDDLDAHRIILLSDAQIQPHLQNRSWLVDAGRNGSGPREAYFRVNNILGVVRACQQGLGIAALPDYLVEENNRLVQLFGETDSIQVDTYFVYPEELKTVARVQVFRDFVVSKAQRWPS